MQRCIAYMALYSALNGIYGVVFATWLVHICNTTSSIPATWRFHMCHMAHSYVWCDSFIYVTWFIHVWHVTHSYIWHDSFICGAWLIHMCATTHSYVRPEINVTWLILKCTLMHSTCPTTHSHVQRDISATCLIHMRRASFICKDVPHSCVLHSYEMCLLYVCLIHMHRELGAMFLIHTNRASFLCTEWRRPIECLELQVIFRKRATNYRACLRKTTYANVT
jgi:hypothetical protein